jgi:hypothetical protein
MPGAKLVVLITLLTSGCSTVDIRDTLEHLSSNNPDSALKAKQIFNRVLTNYGAHQFDKKFNFARVTYMDQWHNLPAKLFNSPYSDDMLVQYEFLLNTFNSRLTFVEGPKKGEIWGIQNWLTYKKKIGDSYRAKRNFKIKFHLPARQFFFELPFILRQFKYSYYLGEELKGETQYHKLFFSNSTSTLKNSDQFIIYINKKSLNIDMIYYTIRELGASFKGANHLSHFQRIDGVLIPFHSDIYFSPEKKTQVHQFRIKKIEFKAFTEKESFYPFPGRSDSYTW